MLDPRTEAAYERLFVGNLAKVLPVGDALLDVTRQLGGPVVVGVTKLYVAFATERRQFALFFPASGRRVTVRLRLEGTVPPGGRVLETASRAPGDRFDVKLHLGAARDVDDEVRELLERARALAV